MLWRTPNVTCGAGSDGAAMYCMYVWRATALAARQCVRSPPIGRLLRDESATRQEHGVVGLAAPCALVVHVVSSSC